MADQDQRRETDVGSLLAEHYEEDRADEAFRERVLRRTLAVVARRQRGAVRRRTRVLAAMAAMAVMGLCVLGVLTQARRGSNTSRRGRPSQNT